MIPERQRTSDDVSNVNKIVVAITPKGKKLNIINDKPSGLYKIQFADGGVLPAVLTGLYTDRSIAKKAVDNYIELRKANG